MLEKYIEYLKFEKRYSKHTLTAYQKDLTQASDFILNTYETELTGSNHNMIRSWMVTLVETGISNRSINRKLSALKSFFKFLKTNGLVSTNPTKKINVLKIEKRLPSFVKENEMQELFSEVEFENSFNGRRDLLILELFYVTGMRLSELINLKESDINNASIKVLGKRNKERIIPISKKTEEHINQFIKEKKQNFSKPSPFLLTTDKGEKMYEKFVYRKVNYYLASTTSMRKKSPHVLRHTFATHMLNNGADLNAIKEILGHANLSATQVYTHNSIKELKNIHKQAHPRG